MQASSRHAAALVFLGLLGLTLYLHGGAIGNWWCCDDPQILKHASRFSPGEYFFEPAAWRSLVAYSLTPWLTLAYDLDHALVGFAPGGFYAHNLLAIALCAWLLYLVARTWLDVLPALGSAVLFLAGVPVALAAQQLMVRHYMEGLCFFLLALWLVIRGVRRGRGGWGLGAGVAFAIAATAKEIYLPLGFLAFLLPLGDFRRRLAVAWPLLVVMGLYVPWRWYMLGDTLGGYTPMGELGLLQRLGALARELAHAPGLLWTAPAYALAAIGLAGTIALARGGIASLGGVAWLFALPPLLLAPLAPLATYPGLGAGSERYYIALWAAVALVVGAALGRLCKDRASWARLLALMLFGMVAYPAWQAALGMRAHQRALHAAHRAVGQAITTHADDTDIIVDANTPSWYNLGLMDLRPALGTPSAPPQLAADLAALAASDLGHRRVLRFDAARGAMVDITAELPNLMTAWREKLRPIRLSVHIELDAASQALRWQFGAERPGSYSFIDRGGQTPLPPQGALRMTQPPRGCFRIRLDSPEGWTAYSPMLPMPTAANQPTALAWQGMADMFDQPATPGCTAEGTP